MKLKSIVLTMILGSCMGTGSAMQNTMQQPLPSSLGMPKVPVDPNRDDSLRRLEMQRTKTMNAERQKQLSRDAAELLNAAGELQRQVQKNDNELSQAEMLHQAELIERLAHNVKERMKGAH